jgi:CheY-like chemotaxis protein
MDMQKMVMIVDDDSDDIEFFCEALIEIDASVQYMTAISGDDALNKLRSKDKILPHFIFLDLNMPRMNGKQLLKELKKDYLLKDIPAIIFSTSSTPKDVEETKALGAAHFLTKPSSFKKLCDDICFILKELE